MRHKLALGVTVLAIASQVALGAEINLIINNKVIETAVKPEEINGTTLVPIRVISEELGAEVKWDKYTQTITIIKDKSIITLKIGSKQCKVNDETYTLLLAPILKSDTTMVPLRFISENLDVLVEWDQKTNTVILNTPKADVVGTVSLEEIEEDVIQTAKDILTTDVVCVGKFDKEGKEYYNFSNVSAVGTRVIINEDGELFDSYVYEEEGRLIIFQQ